MIMRKIVIILLALLIGVNCFSQTKQPVKQKLNYMGSLIYLDENSDGPGWKGGVTSLQKMEIILLRLI